MNHSISFLQVYLLVCLRYFFIPNQAGADFTVPPFGYVTIVNENVGGENNFEFALQSKENGVNSGFNYPIDASQKNQS
jgi:hypothetical protein